MFGLVVCRKGLHLLKQTAILPTKLTNVNIMINYDKLMKLKPTILDTIKNSEGQNIDYIENPTNPEGEIIAIYRKKRVACFTGFFDTEDFYKGSDYEYIYIHSYEDLICSYEL